MNKQPAGAQRRGSETARLGAPLWAEPGDTFQLSTGREERGEEEPSRWRHGRSQGSAVLCVWRTEQTKQEGTQKI